MDGVEAEGRTVNEATEKALEELGLKRDQVDVEVLSEGRPRLLGFRGEPARVRVTPRPAPAATPPPARRAPTRRTTVVDEEADLEDEEEEDEEDEEYDEDEDEEGEDEDEEEEDEDADADEMPAELRRPAPRVAVAPVEHVPADPADVAVAVEVLENLIRLTGLEATVTAREPETAGDGLGMIQAVLDVDGDDLGLLIGRRGQTLASLQYLLNLIVAKQIGKRAAFGVDVDGYRRRREESLVNLAKRTAARVRGTGRSVTLEPMPPNERRIVHITLADDPNVMTVSIGEGEGRKVAITPTR
ncbi:MAG TPA: RNA-binding cell elongation regulator Jag/EloR [Dehalococcoidia bacterium]|nr:RNA-binding cell elongation regulator Jag/EloR [Dehalococcoidia bacterium]